MLDKAKELNGYTLHTHDGDIGKVKDFYFDDQFWTVRYLIADTGNWLTGRQVLISPYSLTGVNRVERNISVSLTKDQIKDSPPLDSDKPVSRQFENFYYGYYGWPGYWVGLIVGELIRTSRVTLSSRATRIRVVSQSTIICAAFIL